MAAAEGPSVVEEGSSPSSVSAPPSVSLPPQPVQAPDGDHHQHDGSHPAHGRLVSVQQGLHRAGGADGDRRVADVDQGHADRRRRGQPPSPVDGLVQQQHPDGPQGHRDGQPGDHALQQRRDHLRLLSVLGSLGSRTVQWQVFRRR
jgi:hypothetical protein